MSAPKMSHPQLNHRESEKELPLGFQPLVSNRGKGCRRRGDRPANAQPISVTAQEIRLEARSFRERLLWDLRQQGYRLREVAELFGVTRQRISQMENDLIRRALFTKAELCDATPSHPRIAWKKTVACAQVVTFDDFQRRVDAVNSQYEARLQNILKRFGGWRKADLLESSQRTLFSKVWPIIQSYEGTPFSFSKLVADFPILAQETYLRQLLSRLRREGILRKVGLVREDHHNLPEVLMTRTPWEELASTHIEKLACEWQLRLQELQARFRPIRSNQSLRKHMFEIIEHEGQSIFGPTNQSHDSSPNRG